MLLTTRCLLWISHCQCWNPVSDKLMKSIVRVANHDAGPYSIISLCDTPRGARHTMTIMRTGRGSPGGTVSSTSSFLNSSIASLCTILRLSTFPRPSDEEVVSGRVVNSSKQLGTMYKGDNRVRTNYLEQSVRASGMRLWHLFVALVMSPPCRTMLSFTCQMLITQAGVSSCH